MFILKEAKESIEFATHYKQLTKATADTEADIPGYIFDELYNLSKQYPQHNDQLVDFLLSKLLYSGWYAKRKAVTILLKLCRRGQNDLSSCLCRRDGDLRKALSLSAPRASIMVDQLQKDTTILVKELMQFIFSPENERRQHLAAGLEDKSKIVGYGSSGNAGRYDGFGTNASRDQSAGFLDKLTQSMMSFFSADEKRAKRERLIEELMKPEPHSYEGDPEIGALLRAEVEKAIARHAEKKLAKKSPASSAKPKAYQPGRPGGGWASDDDDPVALTAEDLKIAEESSPGVEADLEEANFLVKFKADYYDKWPIPDYLGFLDRCKSVKALNIPTFCKLVQRQLEVYCGEIESGQTDMNYVTFLLLIENTINFGIFPIPEAQRRLLELMHTIERVSKQEVVSNKAQKLSWIIEQLFDRFFKSKSVASATVSSG